MKTYTIGIVGGGFVGSAYARAFMDAGFHVEMHDVNEKYADNFPQFSPLPPSISLEDLVLLSDMIFVCVPTPPIEYLDSNVCGGADALIVVDVICNISYNLPIDANYPVCIKSTLSPQATSNIGQLWSNLNLHFSPEFLTEADPLGTLKNTNRNVVGCDGVHDGNIIYVLESVCKNKNAQLVLCSTTEAEIIKLMSNSFLAMKVTFANWFYDVCGMSGANYDVVKLGVGLDKRIGSSHLQVPGPDGKRGYSGSCFPKDVGNIVSYCESNNLEADVMSVIQQANSEYRLDHDWVDNRYRNDDKR